VSLRFEIRVLGSPSLADENGVTPPALGWGKPLALLALLAVREDVRRDEVVDLLWRDVDESKARNAFRQALHRLRTALGDTLVPMDRERLRLVRSDAITVDLDLFDRAVAGGRLEDAIQLYRGDFLEKAELGEPAFDFWAEQERTRLQARFRQVLQDATAQAAAAGRWSDAIARSRRLLSVVPFDTAAAHLAATTLVSAGRRVEAQDLLRQFVARLHTELGLAPPPEIQTLIARLDRQPLEVQSSAQAHGPVAPSLSLVGRESDLSRLLSLWRTTGEDAGSLALINGDHGVGKSRLARELASHAKSLGRATVLTGRERAAAGPVPFGVFAEALRPLVRAAGVAGASRHLLAEAARLLPDLRDNFELPPVTDVEDEASRIRFFEGIAALIDAAAYEQPILLVLEDLQGIAPSSLDLLSYLAVRLAGSGVMIVLTAQLADAPAATATRLNALAGQGETSAPHGSRALSLSLSPLTISEATEATIEAARTLGVSEAAARTIAQRSDGNPARILDLLRRAAAGDEIASLPVSARDLAAERLQRLSSAQRRFFLVVALVGRPITAQIAADAAHVALSAARESVAVLELEGLLERVSDDFFAASELPAQVALDGTNAATRGFLAAWIAEALARDPRVQPAELARFHALAGQSSQAFEQARRAAFAALGIGAVAEAVQLLTSARTFATSPEQQREVESLLVALGSGRRRIGTVPIAAQSPGPSQPQAASAPVTPTPPVDAPERLWVRLFPNWRVLFGAAVATLAISTVVLATRPAPYSIALPLSDTLVVIDGLNRRATRFVTGNMTARELASTRVQSPPSEPPWLDSLSRPWEVAVAAPGGRAVAAARVTPDGTDVYVLSRDRRDTTAIVVGRGDSRPLGWSPDGNWLLVSTSRSSPGGGLSADLRAIRVGAAPGVRIIDSTTGRSVTEAQWSPDGTRIAWVARVGEDRQLEVFSSAADGSSQTNVSRHPADDHRISWSGDGELLAFTSRRDGNSELYAMEFSETRLWRLTRDPAQDDHGVFSRNSRFIAFESTRGGASGVWVMPALGGDAQRVTGGEFLELDGWRGGRGRYVDRVRITIPGSVMPGETTTVRLRAVDEFDEPIASRDVQWTLLDTAMATLSPAADGRTDTRVLTAQRPGLARLVGAAGRWRADTAFVRIGDQQVVVLRDDADPLREWWPLGVPGPTVVTGRSIALNADRQWDSGILSRRSLPLVVGLTLSTTIEAPYSEAADPAITTTVALVAPEDPSTIPPDAPQFLPHASVSWSASAARLSYAVGREVFTEPVPAMPGRALAIRMVVEADSTVTFSANGRVRWRSSLRVIGNHQDDRVQAWIGGRATGDRVRVLGTTVVLAPLSTP
jgi:DNA-binding SARP family transcriptional activator